MWLKLCFLKQWIASIANSHHQLSLAYGPSGFRHLSSSMCFLVRSPLPWINFLFEVTATFFLSRVLSNQFSTCWLALTYVSLYVLRLRNAPPLTMTAFDHVTRGSDGKKKGTSVWSYWYETHPHRKGSGCTKSQTIYCIFLHETLTYAAIHTFMPSCNQFGNIGKLLEGSFFQR